MRVVSEENCASCRPIHSTDSDKMDNLHDIQRPAIYMRFVGTHAEYDMVDATKVSSPLKR